MERTPQSPTGKRARKIETRQEGQITPMGIRPDQIGMSLVDIIRGRENGNGQAARDAASADPKAATRKSL